MKIPLLSLTFGFMLFAILIGISSNSLANEKKSAIPNEKFIVATNKEIIIQVAEINEKNLPEVRKNIEIAGGMAFKGYCKDLHVLMYLMDVDVHSDLNFLNTAFGNVGLGYVIKEGSSIYAVQIACGISPAIEPTQTQE